MTHRRLLELFMSGEVQAELHTKGRVEGIERSSDDDHESIRVLVKIRKCYAGRNALSPEYVVVLVRLELETPSYVVACRDDTAEDGTPGDYVLSTRQTYPNPEAARQATRFINSCRETIVIECPRGGLLRTTGIGGK